MRSSEAGNRRVWLVRRLVVAGCVLAASCSTAPVPNRDAVTSAALECVPADAQGAPADAKLLASLRHTVETGPVYALMVRKAGLTSCRIGNESGRLELDYRFLDGGSLRVRHDPSIEYDDLEARFASPLAEAAIALLTRVEQASFGATGCGIDWRQAETRPAGDDPKATESIYRGDTCNCQARVRSDAAGRVTGLVFRSAC